MWMCMICVCVCIMLSICRLISRSFYFAPTKVWGLLNLFWDAQLKPDKCWRNWSWGLRMGALAFGYVNQPNPSMICTEGQYASRFLLWYGAQLLNWQTRHQPACFTWFLNINIHNFQCFDVFRCFLLGWIHSVEGSRWSSFPQAIHILGESADLHPDRSV